MLETTNEIQRMPKNADSVHQMETHSGFLPAISDDVHFLEALKVQNCETPRSHQCSTVPDAMRYANFVPSATGIDKITEQEM